MEPLHGDGFLDRLTAGELTLMLALRGARTGETVLVAASTGHHCVMVDLEHSTMSVDTAAELCRTAALAGLMDFVRVPEREYGMIGRLLDGGANGIIAPRIETAEQARDVARACRFPPRGQRSQTAMTPQSGMRPVPARELNRDLDARVVVQILVETPAGVAHAAEIAAVEGVDLIAFGANDFTAELGVPGQYRDPRVPDAVATLAEACRRHGKLLMVGGIGDPGLQRELMALGACPLVMTGNDHGLLHEAASRRAAQLTEALATHRP
ncbi:aldolase/citrate lyase family protein [Amycolatopsis sp. NBC_00345]|uniref:HpcH/HpaI aldolase family protein n=1 Tax=Amycolatopsis sp. NBC_00345 TaxID=2975955 RepID=UPI002E255E81